MVFGLLRFDPFLGSGEQYKIIKLRLKISTFKFTTVIYFSLKDRESCYFGVEGNKRGKKLQHLIINILNKFLKLQKNFKAF
jgi:hypothetical protein